MRIPKLLFALAALIFITPVLHAQTWQYANGTATFTGGNVGIGLTNPLAPLHVYGGVAASSGGSVIYDKGAMSNQFYCSFYGNSLQQAFIGTPANVSNRLDLGTSNGTMVLTLLGSNVGIGTTTPAYPLHIVNPNSGGPAVMALRSSYSGTADSYVGDFGDYGTIIANDKHPSDNVYTNSAVAPNQYKAVAVSIGGYNNPYMFSVDNYPSGTLTERLVVDWNGNTGIGLKTPVSKLDIVTGVGDGTTNEANCLRIRHSSTAGNSQLLQLGVNNTAIGGNNNGYSYISSVYWGGSDQSPLVLNPKGGPVGLGLTSGVNWSATVAGTVAVRASSATANNTLMGKLVFAHSAPYTAQSSFIAGVYDKSAFYSGAGMVFHTVSGSDISGVDGVERMRISSDGNVGIATASPTEKLEVNGNVKSTGFILPTGAAAGKVLTSDANGIASWQTASSSASGWALNGSMVGAIKSIGTVDNYDLPIITNSIERMRILANGGVAIGTGSLPATDALLAVKGNVYAQKIKVTQNGWADYVFDPGYKLRPLNEVENYIQQQHHLPEVPSAEEVKKDGLDVGDSQAVLLKKIEELTLYVIEQNKKMEALTGIVQEQNKKIEQLSKRK